MIDLIDASRRVLQEAGVVSAPLDVPNVMALAFEGATLIGFVITYDEPENLLARWNKDAQDLISAHQLGLRRAQSKAWNTYLVLLASGHGRQEEQIALGMVEENLLATRKIARAGIQTHEDLRRALLPLLPIQNTPRLEAVDMRSEIAIRTTELPPRVVEAFLSNVSDAIVARVLEEEP